MPRKTGTDVFFALIALAIFIALTLARSAQEKSPELSAPSSYDAGRYGYRALYELLLQERARVMRFQRNHHFLDASISTLILAQSGFEPQLPGAGGISRNDVLSIKDWIRAGGRLIVLAPPYGSELDTLLGIPASRNERKTGHTAFPFAQFAITQGVRTVKGDYRIDFAWAASPKAMPLLVTRDGVVALQYRFGKGSVIAFTDPGIFSNVRLTDAQNARFAVQLVRASNGLSAFDESIHGYEQGDSLWQALPPPARWGVWIILAAVIVGTAGGAMRFAPPIVLDRPDERDSSAYITSMANLLARGGASRKALRDAADSALRSVRRSLGVSDRTPISAVLTRLPNPQRGRVLELDRLGDLEHPTNAELLRAGVLSAQLRKDFGL